MTDLHDDLDAAVPLPAPARRVVSLVPSLTEAIAVSAPEVLVGATDWCTHPADLDVVRVRGTKNPDLARIAELQPDLVVCNQEENRELDVARLRSSGIAVWVTRIESLDDAFSSLGRLFSDALGRPRPDWLTEAERAWSAPVHTPLRPAVVPIWRDPWMVVGGRTFTNDLLGRLGFSNPFEQHDSRYPHTTIDEIATMRPDVVLLPDEPYVFTPDDGPEAFPGLRCALVSGRLLTWYGPSLVDARAQLSSQIAL